MVVVCCYQVLLIIIVETPGAWLLPSSRPNTCLCHLWALTDDYQIGSFCCFYGFLCWDVISAVGFYPVAYTKWLLAFLFFSKRYVNYRIYMRFACTKYLAILAHLGVVLYIVGTERRCTSSRYFAFSGSKLPSSWPHLESWRGCLFPS